MQDIMRLVLQYLTGVWRYRWFIVIVPALVSPVGWFYVATLPDRFLAAARVYVDTDSVLNPLMAGIAVRIDDNRRIQMMTKLLFSREILEKLARMTDLDLKAKTPAQMEGVVNSLKSRVSLRNQGQNIYALSFEDESSDLAKRVVQSFLTIFVETNLGESRKDQDSAEQFILREIKEYERRLEESERKRTEFKARNLGFLSNTGGYYNELQSGKGTLEGAKLDLQIAEERRNELQQQMYDLEAEGAMTVSPGDAVSGPASPLDARIQAMQTQLDELLLRYTKRHPEVVSLSATIDRLKEERRQQAEVASEGLTENPLAGNPIYQQMRLLLSEAQAEVASKQAIVKEYERRIDQLQKAVERALQVETEQQQLNRDYEIMKTKHNSLMERLESLRLGRQVDTSAETVRFRVIEPPKVPDRPSGPNRMALSSSVFGGALGGGVAIAFLISLLRPTFNDRKQLGDVSGVAVLGSINMIWTDRQRRRQRAFNAAFAASALLLLLAFGAVLAVYNYEIDVLSRLPGL